jgi:hypothetical protein
MAPTMPTTEELGQVPLAEPVPDPRQGTICVLHKLKRETFTEALCEIA